MGWYFSLNYTRLMNPVNFFLALVISIPLWHAKVLSSTEKTPGPKNVILLIADGMGLSQMTSAYFNSELEPAFSRFPVVGLIKTSSAKEKITDSAAGATAFACGEKTYNGAISVNLDSAELPIITQHFSAKGASTGVVATSSVTHATPACFYAHAVSRNMAKDIAYDLLTAPLSFFAGGGAKYFDDELREKLASQGWSLSDELTDPETLDGKDKLGFLLAEDGMPKMSEGRGDYLTKATGMAIRFLSQDPEGFFLMAEGSQIDWGGHANDGEYIVKEVLDFEQCVAKVLDYAERNGETLVIVTADHETGGFTLAGTEKKVPFMGYQRDYNEIDMRFSSGGHSAAMVPVLAFGPGAEAFGGIYENTEIYHKIIALTRD